MHEQNIFKILDFWFIILEII